MRLDEAVCRSRLAGRRVAGLATVSADLQPHVVPITFAIDGNVLVTAIDQKPKTTTSLRRLRNVTENPRVALLADHYADDWSQLWWVRADGRGSVDDDALMPRDQAITLLSEKYAQYRHDPPLGPMITIQVTSWSGWSAAD